MKIFDLLCSDNFREGLAQYINEQVPELVECTPNNKYDNCVKIYEYNHPSKPGKWSNFYGPHHFSMILHDKEGKNYSSMGLWEIRKESDLDDIEMVAIRGEWGYKGGFGWLYPDLGLKVKNVIIEYIRITKLKRILNGKI